MRSNSRAYGRKNVALQFNWISGNDALNRAVQNDAAAKSKKHIPDDGDRKAELATP
jgi:hypothetical protein